MPEFTDREIYEARLAEELGLWMTEQEKEILRLIGAEFAMQNVPENFWEEERDALVPVLAVTLGAIFAASVEQLPEEEPLFTPIDVPSLQSRSSNFAQQYSYELVTGINDTTRSELQRKVSQAIENDWAVDQLRESLAPQYGPTRAGMIAQTETTRAAVQGEIAAVEEMAREHQVLIEAVWQTNPELSATGPCPICSPLDGRAQGDGWIDEPPAHPRCVCSLNYRRRDA